MLNKLLHQLRVMTDCACWGRPLGSTLLWEQHLRTINRILSIANHIQIREVKGMLNFRNISFIKHELSSF
jgi:F-box protein 25/32